VSEIGRLVADTGAALPSERLAPEERIRRRADYQRCYQTGRRLHGSLMTLHVGPNSLGHPRLGITASRRVGGSVVRQRVKRRVRECYRRWNERSRLPAVDVVVHPKPPAGAAGFPALEAELLSLLGRLLPDGRRAC
jgi:ribonuclease P protein component